METQESNTVRIVHLDETFTEASLRNLIQLMIQPKGNLENVYIRKDYKLEIVYAYLIFQFSDDALRTSQSLNGYTYNNHKFDVALIGPLLIHTKYHTTPKITINKVRSQEQRNLKWSARFQRKTIDTNQVLTKAITAQSSPGPSRARESRVFAGPQIFK